MKGYDGSIDIRSIQQFLYCPHRFGLIEIDCAWSENVFVYKGNRVHETVESGKITSSKSGVTERSVRVFNDEWGLFGVVDCLEFKKSAYGNYCEKYKGNFEISIVEYKPTAPKYKDFNYEDAMQLIAQKICVDSIFKTDCKTYFYYNDTRRRVNVNFTENDYNFLKKTINEMHYYLDNCIIPQKSINQNCSGCSMKDMCLPRKNKGEASCENY